MTHRLLAGLAFALAACVACASDGVGDAGSPASLAAAAEDVVAFLRGDRPFERLRLADTVTLRLAPEGGGTLRRVPRQALRDPSAWTIPGGSGRPYSFVPPPGLTELTLRVGRHLNCMERSLGSVAPELASLPHVGAMLGTPEPASCLQTWNLTLVFAPEPGPPTLVAAVYDQWEW